MISCGIYASKGYDLYPRESWSRVTDLWYDKSCPAIKHVSANFHANVDLVWCEPVLLAAIFRSDTIRGNNLEFISFWQKPALFLSCLPSTDMHTSWANFGDSTTAAHCLLFLAFLASSHTSSRLFVCFISSLPPMFEIGLDTAALRSLWSGLLYWPKFQDFPIISFSREEHQSKISHSHWSSLQ